ncbi:MAG: DUF6172 family protein [Opitutaceae bacterium]|jgi:Family of unknown function (DUF6172)
MKKTFSLSAPDREPQRVIDAIKHDVRKYVKRERRKTLPEGTDFWDFACKLGASSSEATAKPLNEINSTIDALAASGATEIYLEITAIGGRHIRHAAAPLGPEIPAPHAASAGVV